MNPKDCKALQSLTTAWAKSFVRSTSGGVGVTSSGPGPRPGMMSVTLGVVILKDIFISSTRATTSIGIICASSEGVSFSAMGVTSSAASNDRRFPSNGRFAVASSTLTLRSLVSGGSEARLCTERPNLIFRPKLIDCSATAAPRRRRDERRASDMVVVVGWCWINGQKSEYAIRQFL